MAESCEQAPASASRCAARKTCAWCAAQGRYTADENSARPGLCRHGALAARACAHPRHRRPTRPRPRRACWRCSPAPTVMADGLKPIPHKQWSQHPAEIPLANTDGSTIPSPRRTIRCRPTRCASSARRWPWWSPRRAAKDAAERVAIDYEPLPCGDRHGRGGARRTRRACDEARSNVCFDAQLGDAAATAAAFAQRAAHVTKFETWVQRVTGVPMEPRAALGDLRRGDRALHASMPATAARCGSSTISRPCSACRPNSARAHAATSAAISARAA